MVKTDRSSGVSVERTVSRTVSFTREENGDPMKSTIAASPDMRLMNPVVEDTLSDIDEAISEISSRNKIMKSHNQRHSTMSTRGPQLPIQPQIQQDMNDSSSEYSRHDDINSDSDIEEEDQLMMFGPTYSVDEVSQWTPAEVATYLRSRKVNPTTCDKFEEQEVTGAIMMQLQMPDLKELDLGSFGKRFEAWKEIEYLLSNLQLSRSRASSSVRMSMALSGAPSIRSRSSTAGITGILPRIPSQHNRPASRIPQHRINVREANLLRSGHGMQPPGTAATIIDETPMTGMFERPRSPPSSPPRNRDSTFAHQPSMALQHALSSAGRNSGYNVPHRRESSFDKNWKLSIVGLPDRPSTSAGPGQSHKLTSSTGTSDSIFTGDSGFSGSPHLLEKNYFSERETSGARRAQHSASSSAYSIHSHNRKTSYTEEQRMRAASHSRIGSADTVRGGATPPKSSTFLNAYRGVNVQPRRKSNSFSEASTFVEPKIPHSALSGTPKRGASDSVAGSGPPFSISVTGSITTEKKEHIVASPISISSSTKDSFNTTQISVTASDSTGVNRGDSHA